MIKFFLLLILTSCSGFINQLDKGLLDQKQDLYFGNQKSVYCKEPTKIELINSNPYSQKAFYATLKGTFKDYKFNFIEKIVLWSLVQFNLRPDINSPSSKLQLIIDYKGKDNYYHFFSKDKGSYPAFYGLESILKIYNSKYSLMTLARLIDRYFAYSYKVSYEFELFLNKNKEELFKKPTFKEKFFQGDETLRENENIQSQNLTDLIKIYQKKKSKYQYNTSTKLFEFKNKSLQAKCNYDMNMYSNSIYLIHKKFINSHIYGMQEDKNYFISSASQDIEPIKGLENTHFFEGKSQSRSAAFCKFDFKQKQNIWMVSTKSRDPGQHLFHLIEYGVEKIQSIKELDQIMRFSRHLFLENPHRLIIEFKRSSEKQLERILKIDIPIYNANTLGKVWGHYSSKSDSNFIIDDRGPGEVLCK